MRFSELARHAVWPVPTDRERIQRFIDGLTYQLRLLMTRERVSGATFDEVVSIARQIEMARSQEQVEREAKRPHGSGGFGGVPPGGQFYYGRGHPYRHAQMAHTVHHGASSVHSASSGHGSYSTHQGQSSLSALPAQSSPHAPSVQGSSAPSSSRGYSGARDTLKSPPPFTGRGYFECGDMGHINRYCPRLTGGSTQQRS
ncbi:uncharacterized protein [Nicotiana tomentosiformis]|uniref:uncharacterized protein n=1 Tax=Nicotiana tomentosiformis TaxID=4098 RepID=UPI00388C60CF